MRGEVRCSGARRGERRSKRLRLRTAPATPAEISCVMRGAVTSSRWNEHIHAFDKSRTRVCCGLRFGGISLGARAERFTTITPARPQGCESCRTQLRGDDDRLRQLRSCRSSATGQRAGAFRSLFQNSGVDSAVGRIAVSWRKRLRARAACGVGSSGGSSSPLLDVNQAAKPHLL